MEIRGVIYEKDENIGYDLVDCHKRDFSRFGRGVEKGEGRKMVVPER